MTHDAHNAKNPSPQPPTDPTLDAALTRALEHPPVVAIPANFAARVRTSLPARAVAPRRTGAARIAATGAAAASLVALCWLAPHAAPNFASLAFDMELALLAELAAIAAWFASMQGNA